MFNQTSNNHAYYSEKNDTSEFRFVRMTKKTGTDLVVEHKCGTCGTVQIENGYTYNLPNGFVQVVCPDCAEKEEVVTSFCVSCDIEIADGNHYDTFEVPDDWDFPKTMFHFNSICKTCMEDDTVSNETPIFDFPKDPEATATEARLDRLFQKLEDKIDALQDYVQGREALFRDLRDGEITMEDVEAALERLKTRLK